MSVEIPDLDNRGQFMTKIAAVVLLFCSSLAFAQIPAPSSRSPIAVVGVATPAAQAKGDVLTPPVQVEQTGSQVYVLIITSVFTLLGTMCTGFVGWKVAQLNQQAKVAGGVAVETKKTVDAVHVLVNSNMRIALEANAILSRRIADVTKTTGDINAANAAEEKVRQHDKAQAEVDAREKKG